MNLIVVPVLAAITYAASILIAKYGLTRRRISIRDYIPGVFLSLSVFALITLTHWGGANTSLLSKWANLWQLVAIIVVATIWNLLYYIGLSKEKINTSEGLIILMPLATIVLSWLFTPQNFDGRIAVAMVSATALIAWAFKPSRFVHFDIYGLMLFVAVILMSLENVLVARLLKTNALTPASLYAIRTFLIFIIFYIYYRPSFPKLSSKTIGLLTVSGFIGTSAMLLRFYGLRDAGITLTAVILILVPVIVFGWAVTFFHERMSSKRIVAVAAVGAIILYASIINYHLLIQQ